MWLFRYLMTVPQTILYFVFSMVPKNKQLWILSSWKGQKFSDHPKYLYLYLKKNPQLNIVPIWITKDKQQVFFLKENGVNVYYALSFKGFLAQIRASVAIYTHSVEWEFIPSFVGHTCKRVQTWHGCPIKKIGFDDHRDPYLKLKMAILSVIAPYLSHRCDLMIAACDDEKKTYEKAFGLRSNKVVVTGHPRLDNVFAQSQSKSCNSVKLIYLPTFRGAPGSDFTLWQDSNFPYYELGKLLELIDGEFYVKLHPVQQFHERDIALIETIPRIKLIPPDHDIYSDLGSYDILVTDFSGVYFDFLITGKPIIMAAIELDAYLKNDRALYYNYDEISPASPCYTWSEVLTQIQYYARTPMIADKYKRLQDKFHKYKDANSSLRVITTANKFFTSEHTSCG